jgi:carboxymethylenebutenolidase
VAAFPPILWNGRSETSLAVVFARVKILVVTNNEVLHVERPDGPARGGLIVVQEAFGVNDHIRDVCRRLASEGWLSVAPKLWHRTGAPEFGYTSDSSERRQHMGALAAEGILDDVDAALALLAERGVPIERVGVVGFCMGGTVALLTAVRRDVAAAVSFYGGGVREGRFGFGGLVDEAPNLRAPWLGLYGDLDTGIPVAEVEDLRAAAQRSGQVTALIRYPEAGHGYNCDVRESYHAPSAADAWRRMLDWFESHVPVAAPG